jgi:hypothetical protein
MPDIIIMEDGYHSAHDPSRLTKAQSEVTRRWFAEQWSRLNLGGVMMTSAGAYLKTERGFRKCSRQEALAVRARTAKPPVIQDGRIKLEITLLFGRRNQPGAQGFGFIGDFVVADFKRTVREQREAAGANIEELGLGEWVTINDVMADNFSDAIRAHDRQRISDLCMLSIITWAAFRQDIPIETCTRVVVEVPLRPDRTGHRMISVGAT